MPRLFRPAIPLEVKCRVAMLQLGEIWPDEALKANKGGLGDFLGRLLFKLSQLLNCRVSDLRLDHDPPLGARLKTGEGKKTKYRPAANDYHHLFYRPHGAQFDKSHDIKTRIRGDHGQYSDLVLIKRERRRQKRAGRKAFFRKPVNKSKLKRKWPKRSFPKRRKR